MADRRPGVRLAELVGTLSLAADLGLGQPMEHVARSSLMACRLGERLGLDEGERAALYYVSLLGWVGCIADSHEAARWFGNDIDYRAGVYDVDMAPLPFLGYLLRRAGGEGSVARRAAVGAVVLATGAKGVQDSLRAHCQVTATIATRLGLDETVAGPLRQIFARWDGKGLPSDVAGEQIALPVRLWHVCDVAEVHHRRDGLAAAVDVLRGRSGTQFDPAVVTAWIDHADELVGGLPDDCWDDLIRSEPGLQRELTEGELDAALEVLGDYADLKSPELSGHSRSVADLAAAAGRHLGMSEAAVRMLRRAGLVHGLGRTGVPNTILDKQGALTPAERERLRLHPYYTERMLRRPAELAEIGAVATLAHERLDGSGYHRGLAGPAISASGRVLAAADAWHTTLRSDGADAAARFLQDEVRSGRLDGSAVDAVLSCVGARPRHRPAGPLGLTPREVEVLVLLARGASNRQIARQLGIAPKTAGNHVERIYAKAGVGTRAAATLVAMQHGLLDDLEPFD